MSNYLEDDKKYCCICTGRAVGGVRRRTPILSISVGIEEVDFLKKKLEVIVHVRTYVVVVA
jgi:hypothetical protein